MLKMGRNKKNEKMYCSQSVIREQFLLLFRKLHSGGIKFHLIWDSFSLL